MFGQISSGNMYSADAIQNIEIDFDSFNQLTLGKSSSNKITVFCTNCTNKTIPKVDRENGIMTISTQKEELPPNTHQNKFRAGQPLYADYEINIPENLSVIINYEDGNFKTTNFTGNLQLNLNQGALTIADFKGVIAITSHSGTIDCQLASATIIEVENSQGETHTDLELTAVKKTKSSLKGIYKNNDNTLKIKTVNTKVTLTSVITK